MEIFKFDRQIRHLAAGKKLRVLAGQAFHLIWSADEWKTVCKTEGRNTGLSRATSADVETEGSAKPAEIEFTFFWLGTEARWEGRKF